MTKNILSRILAVGGLFIAGSMMTYAQGIAYHSSPRWVPPGSEQLQPVAASYTALHSVDLGLTAQQRSQLSALDNRVAAMHQERARLWNEYRQIIARPDYNDEIAGREVTPRMLRIVAINTQLAGIVQSQNPQVASILSDAQRVRLNQAIETVKASL